MQRQDYHARFANDTFCSIMIRGIQVRGQGKCTSGVATSICNTVQPRPFCWCVMAEASTNWRKWPEIWKQTITQSTPPDQWRNTRQWTIQQVRYSVKLHCGTNDACGVATKKNALWYAVGNCRRCLNGTIWEPNLSWAGVVIWHILSYTMKTQQGSIIHG